VPDWDLYVHQRSLLEPRDRQSRNVWNGRPISKIVLAEPLVVLDGMPVDDWVPQRLVTATGPNPLLRWTRPLESSDQSPAAALTPSVGSRTSVTPNEGGSGWAGCVDSGGSSGSFGAEARHGRRFCTSSR
jgi:hypothetical protein